MQSTPQANRIHIAIFGRTNSGKSTLLNTLTGQDTAMTSPERGTTTDPVYKAMEVAPLGACVWIDTAGIDDDTVLGGQRIERTRQVMDKTDMAVLLLRSRETDLEKEWLKELNRRKIPVIVLINVEEQRPIRNRLLTEEESGVVIAPVMADKGPTEAIIPAVIDKTPAAPITLVQIEKEPEATLTFYQAEQLAAEIKEMFGLTPLLINAKTGQGLELFWDELVGQHRFLEKESSICGDLVRAGDSVLLVMPQDIQAPKGRLILPQVQTIRELLDRQCLVQCVTAENVSIALKQMKRPPHLIITDSQLFAQIAAIKPEESLLTSFSVLFSRYKGDIEAFLEGAKILKKLPPNAEILIAEACTHRPLQEDIGRVKLPRLLKQKLGSEIKLVITAGADFPQDLGGFDLIIHCGGCMFNRRHVMSRVARAKEQDVPITNYGIAIAALTGILDQIVY